MSYIVSHYKEMEDYGIDVSVVDVYDIASEIGKEFEKIIDAHGTDAVTSLMPKVIGALEHLENLALRNERENTTIADLNARITKLEMEKIEKAEDRQRFERELEQIEEHWRQESKDLVSLVQRLQDENRKLTGLLAEKRQSNDDPGTPVTSEVDVAVFQRLRNMVDKQREQLRAKDKEMSIKTSELETLTSQVDRLTTIGKELRRKHKITQSQVRTLIDERADFLAQLQDQQREITTLRQSLGIAEKENEDLTKTVIETPDLKNKAVYDLDDPNRPRFTTTELKEILQERNELKARVSDLEDELDVYRPKDEESESSSLGSCLNAHVSNRFPSPVVLPHDRPPPSNDSTTFQMHALDALYRLRHFSSKFAYPNADDEDAPVQGPLPYEPDDAPWKKASEPGIRKFFRKLFSESNITFLGSSPKRSLSTLSKMALSSTTTHDTKV